MSGVDAPGGEPPAIEATLTELAEKLAKLRAHLEHVRADLNGPREDSRVIRSGFTAPAAGRDFGNYASAADRLRCHECRRTAPHDATGWTVRLCGDDALHTFCPDCDHRYFNGNGCRPSAAQSDRI